MNMKRVVLLGLGSLLFAAATHPVLAAELPVKAPLAKAPAAIFDWTGWYGGINFGTGPSQTTGVAAGDPGSFDRAGTGYSVGLQGGYNWHFSSHGVAGIEADINWLGIDRHRQDSNEDAAVGVRTGWYATARGRLGYTSSPSLFYVTGGAAFTSLTNRFDDIVGGTSTSSRSEIAGGWTAGWGTETMLGGNWSARSEYLYIDAGSQSVFNPTFDAGTTGRFDNRFHVFRSALNYRFGGPQPMLPAYDWTGLYIGVNAGVGVSQVRADNTDDGDLDIAGAGFSGGLQVGYNWQLGPNWVGGVEADIGWLGINRNEDNWNDAIRFGVRTGWYGTARARLGRSAGPALLYVTGGAAFVSVENNFDDFFAPSSDASKSKIASGWVVGSGIEATLGNNWTARTEYLYIDAGSQDVFNPTIGDTTRYENRFHVFRFGLNRRFASGNM